MYGAIEIGEPLRIVGLRVARLCRGAARDVAERAETRGGTGVLGVALSRRCGVERAKRRRQRAIAPGRSAREIRSLARIGGGVGPFGDWEVDVCFEGGDGGG